MTQKNVRRSLSVDLPNERTYVDVLEDDVRAMRGIALRFTLDPTR
jgi:hypothetical protein